MLESVCKDHGCTSENLVERINNLVKKEILTERDVAILHKIRTLGNSAAHEVKPHDEDQLAAAMSIVEHLLKTTYILPHQAKSLK